MRTAVHMDGPKDEILAENELRGRGSAADGWVGV